MKKRKLLIGALILGVAALTACKPTPEPPHEHTYATEWSKNETTHWHQSTCEHDLKKDEAEHTFDNGVVDGNNIKYGCTVCDYSYIARNEVSEQGWKDAFDNSKKTNYTAVLSSKDIGTVTYKYYAGDDKIIAYISVAASSVVDLYYVKDSSTFSCYQKSNEKWVKYASTLSEMNDASKKLADWILSYTFVCPNFGEFYDEFNYSDNSLSYNFIGEEGSNEIKTNAVFGLGYYDVNYYNAEVKFEDGNLKQITAYMSGQKDSAYALNTITFSDYGTTTVEIPNVG